MVIMDCDFIRKFHAIEGVSIAERQRNLNKFLKNVPVAAAEKQFILDNLNPKTYLENVFYIDVLIHLRDANRLLKIFKDGNGAFVSKIIKQPWFFQEAFNNITPKTLVDDFLPSFSFTIKIKLLRNLSHVYTEEKIDEVYDYVANRYGSFMAETFITACSSEKIASLLKKNKIKLSTHQLKTIYKKEANLINIYLEEQNQYNTNIFDKTFLTYLAQKNPIHFWELIKKYQIDEKLKLGRRTTKKLIQIKAEDIVNDPNKYIKYLRYDTLVRKLNKQGHFKQLYFNIFPRKLEAFHNGYNLSNTLLKYYPKTDQYNLFTKTFTDIMKEDIWNYTNCLQDHLLELITDKKVRENWVQIKYDESGNEEYLIYYETKKSIPLIKEKINTTSSIRNRSKLIILLVKSCAVNKDFRSLEEVLKYFCVRHKNDDRKTRVEFMRALDNNFNLEEFTSTHWKYINEILNTISLNNGYDLVNFKFRIKHIDYLFNNNGSEEDKTHFVLEYIKEQLEFCGLNFYGFDDTNNSEIQRIILIQVVEHIDTMMKKIQTQINRSYIKSHLVGKILWFNTKHPEKSINIQNSNNLIEYLRTIPKGEEFLSYLFHLHLPNVICKLNRNEFENEFLNFYFTNKSFRQYSLANVLQWFIKYDPNVIVNNFDLIMESFPLNMSCFWAKIKKYDHISLDDKVVKHCLHQIENGDYNQKSKFIQPLSIIGNSECYIKIMTDLNLIPTSSKVAVDDEESRKVYQIQKVFLKNFKNLWSPLSYLPLLIDKFCQGDYLQLSLTPLYIAFHKIPENKLEIYLNELASNRATSAKKHGLFLARFVFDQTKVSQIFNTFQENQNESLERCMCLSSLRYFTKIQTQEYFEKLLLYMKFIKKHDTELLEVLSSVQIPKKFKPYYIINLWNLLETLKMNLNAVKINTFMTKVLDNIDKECLSNLPEDFCKVIINNYFGISVKKENELCNIFEFVIKFLMYHKNQTDNFNYIFQLISDYKSQLQDLNGKERSIIHKFFNAFFTTVYKKEVDLQFVNTFSTEWENIFSESDTFKEHILLNILRFQQEKKNIELYSKRIVLYAEQINTKYGEFVFSKFVTAISEFCIFGNEDNEIITLLTAILKYKASTLNCIFVMELITNKGDLYYNNRIRPMYREIDSILKEVNDPKVQLCYNIFTKIE